MRLSSTYFLASTLAAVCTFTGVSATDFTAFTISDDSKKIHLSNSKNDKLTVEFTGSNDSLYTYFMADSTKTDSLTVALADAPHNLKLINGMKVDFTVPTSAATDISIVSKNVTGDDKFTGTPTKHKLTAKPEVSGTKLKLTFMDGTTAKTVEIDGVDANILAFRAFQGTVSAPINFAAAGSFEFEDSFTNHVIKLYIPASTSGAQPQLLVFLKSESNASKLGALIGRPIAYAAMTASIVAGMNFVVKTFDPEMYTLGGGFYGALLGQDASEANSQETVTMADSENLDTDDLSAPDQSGRPRSERTSSSPSGLTTDADNANNAEMDSDNGDSDDVAEKADARVASLIAVALASLALLL